MHKRTAVRLFCVLVGFLGAASYNYRMNKDIRTYPLAEIPQLCKDAGLPRFRSNQLIRWLYVNGASSYDEMGNLPKAMRQKFSELYPLSPIETIDKQVSSDGTRKYVFGLSDGTQVEAVGIPSRALDTEGNPKHLTVCFSTQAGCPMQCAFCATGDAGFERNLSAGEMIMQILLVQKDFGIRVSNVVAMGQGEPFLNYDNALEALRFLNSKDGFEIGARHITISTCGILDGIRKLSDEPEQFTLAVSLHAARQSVRDELMPRCASAPLPQLKEALADYIAKTGRRVSFEYLMIDGVNDTDDDLAALIDFCQGLLCHVNLIPLNAVEHSPFQPSPAGTIKHWIQELEKSRKEATLRDSRGADIDGACGQLKNKLR